METNLTKTKDLNLVEGKFYQFRVRNLDGTVMGGRVYNLPLTLIKRKGTRFSDDEVARIIFSRNSFYDTYCKSGVAKREEEDRLLKFIHLNITNPVKSFMKVLRTDLYVFGDYEFLAPAGAPMELLMDSKENQND